MKNYGAITDPHDIVNKKYVDDAIGEIEAALDEIIALQETFVLPEAEGVEFGNV